MRIRLTGNPVDGSQRAQDTHGPDGRQADVVSVQRVLQHSAGRGGDWREGGKESRHGVTGILIMGLTLPKPRRSAGNPAGRHVSGTRRLLTTNQRGARLSGPADAIVIPRSSHCHTYIRTHTHSHTPSKHISGRARARTHA